MTKLDIHTECRECKYKRLIPGEEHIACAHPDPSMKGHPIGIKRGWFDYPVNFDPIWKLNLCNHWEKK
jgi:hypothetical protein